MQSTKETRIFIVHGRMYWITKEELAQEVEPEDVDEVWEDLPKTEKDALKWFLPGHPPPAKRWDRDKHR